MTDFSRLIDKAALAKVLARRGYVADALVDAELDRWVLATFNRLLDQLVQDGVIDASDRARQVVARLRAVPR